MNHPFLLSRFRLLTIIRHLRSGGLVAYPTEGVFGLGCDPFNQDAVQRLLSLKRRALNKGFILIASEFSQVEHLLAVSDPEMRNRMLATWPGPVTWIAPVSAKTPAWLRGRRASLAVRVTAHPLAALLCQSFGGPLISTSANLSMRPPANSSLKVRRIFRTSEVMLIPGRTSGLAGPTAIYRSDTGARLR
jgi:L-threonylcarbamoyladenylate synthase